MVLQIFVRILGIGLALIYLKHALPIPKKLLEQGISTQLNIREVLTVAMLISACGVALLKEWGRALMVISCLAMLILLATPSVIKLQIPIQVVKSGWVYLVIVGLMLYPKMRSQFS